jgi:hypothetical protein
MTINIDLLTTPTICQNQIGLAAQTPALPFLIQAASQLITQSCNRPFWLSTNAANPIVEYLGGSGDPYLPLGYWPVQSIVSIYNDNAGFWGQTSGSFASATLLNQGTDYALEVDSVEGTSKSAIVLRINGIWDSVYLRDGGMLASYGTNGQGNVQVTYRYGFTSLPYDLQWAATLLVARMLLTNAGRLLNSVKFEEFAATYDNWNALPDDETGYGILAGEVEGVISKYRIFPVQLVS